jgi:hypothetical protein
MVWLVVALLGVMFTANAMQQATARQEPVPVAPTTQGSTPVTLGAMRGVLFRIFPPIPTELPAEHAVTEPANAGGGSQAKAASAKSSKAASTLSQPQPSYLLGTIHFGSPEQQGIDYAILEKALAGVETFVNEANLDEAWKPAYDDYRWLSPEQPLSSMIGKDSYAMAHSLLPNVRAQDLVRMGACNALQLHPANAWCTLKRWSSS